MQMRELLGRFDLHIIWPVLVRGGGGICTPAPAV
jgi:hypothetical protein